MCEDRVVVAVGIDILNAFNSLAWKIIRRAMLIMRFPDYLCSIVLAYLMNRRLVYLDCFGNYVERRLLCSVRTDPVEYRICDVRRLLDVLAER